MIEGSHTVAMIFHRLGREADARSALNETARGIDEWTGLAMAE
jgi:hypothetical protein